MKEIFGYLLYFIMPTLFFGVIYAMAGFYYLDLDPHKWSEMTRLMIALEGLLFAALGVFVAYAINKNIKDK